MCSYVLGVFSLYFSLNFISAFFSHAHFCVCQKKKTFTEQEKNKRTFPQKMFIKLKQITKLSVLPLADGGTP